MEWWIDTLVQAFFYFLAGRLSIWAYKWNDRRMGRKVLKVMKTKYKGEPILFYSVDTTDREALKKLERQIRGTTD